MYAKQVDPNGTYTDANVQAEIDMKIYLMKN